MSSSNFTLIWLYSSNIVSFKIGVWVSLTTKSAISTNGFIMVNIQVGIERYHITLDTVKEIPQGYYMGYNSKYNFYMSFLITGTNIVKMRLEETTGYSVSTDFNSSVVYISTYKYN